MSVFIKIYNHKDHKDHKEDRFALERLLLGEAVFFVVFVIFVVIFILLLIYHLHKIR